jgi:hypothetical protein
MPRNDGLRIIFSFFLGLMLTAFFGVGVYTFHPPPDDFDRQLRELSRSEQEIMAPRAQAEPTAAERERLRELARQQEELMEAAAGARRDWGRSTSIVLIVLATLTMAVSLVRADQLPVISSGLLLGGVFTMLYGVGWIIASDTSVTRFLVMTVALAITLGLGYARFVRRPGAVSGAAAAGAPGAPEGPAGAEAAEIERRLRLLEERMRGAARALGEEAGGPPNS